MRQLQVGIFILGLAAFVVALFFVGGEMGDILWRLGIAALLLDLVCLKLWPSGSPAGRS
jgi:uncharacterized YccA/Bax inhibitor family protein